MAVTSMANSSLGAVAKFGNMSTTFAKGPFRVEYLVVAGGAAGAGINTPNQYVRGMGGGGAGGVRSSITGDSSGGGASAETAPFVFSKQILPVEVGAGGAGTNSENSNVGSNSQFGLVTSVGGGRTGTPAGSGGSGGGGNSARTIDNRNGGAGTSGQGYAGGTGADNGGDFNNGGGGGGGGAGEVGENGISGNGVCVNGGDGVTTTVITDSQATSLSVGEVSGSDVYFGGGGAGGGFTSAQSGGLGGGGASGAAGGGAAQPGGNADASTGGGGGGACSAFSTGSNVVGGNGGSGVVLVRFPKQMTVTVGAGLTYSTVDSGLFTTYVFTAGSDDVEIG